MKNLTAIIQCFDTGPLESLVVMLRSVGFKAALPNDQLCRMLRDIGCDTVYSLEKLASMGYEAPLTLPTVGVADMSRTNVLYIDVKAHRNGPKVWNRWPNLQNKTLWYRINGGKPEHVIRADGMDCGDEVNPPCPVLTPNQWYTRDAWLGDERNNVDNSYAFWPPFHQWSDYQHPRVHDTRPHATKYDSPICLIHNLRGWGYEALIEQMRDKLGVHCYGEGSPDGLINHREIPARLSSAVAMVHLKSNDAPGYAIYEAMASACPIICTRRLIWRCRMQDLLIPDETCLVFDRETHDGLSTKDVVECTREVTEHLKALHNPVFNAKIGESGRRRLKEIMWSQHRKEDVESLRTFMERNYGPV